MLCNVGENSQNRPFPSSPGPLYQNEVRCSTFLVEMSFICMRMKTHFHIKGGAPNLVLIQRPWGTRKWPILRNPLKSAFDRFLSTSMFFCSSMYIEPALNFREECNESTDLLSWRLSLFLSRDSLSCDTHSWDLFLYLWYVPPHSCAFHTFCFRPIISYVYYHLKYFSYPLWFCWSAKARNGIIQWNFA